MARTADFTVKQNDTSPDIQCTLDGIDSLSGCTVTFHARRDGTDTAQVDAAATVVDEDTPTVKYVWQSGDTATVGWYRIEWEVTLPSGAIVTFPNNGYDWLQIVDDLA